MADTEQFAPKRMIASPTRGAESRTRSPATYREAKRNGSPSGVSTFVAFARRSKLMIGSFFLFAFVILFWLAIVQRNGIHGPGVVPLNIWDVAVLVGANLVGSLFVFLIVFGFLQYLKDTHREEVLLRTVVEPLTEVFHKGQETVCVQTDQIDWASLFTGADEIFLLGQGWDGWEKRVDGSLPEFLDRGGKIRAILLDPDEPDLVAAVAEQWGREPKEIEREIRQAVSALQEKIVSHLGTEKARAQFLYSYAKQLSSFSGIYFKPGKLLLSMSPHRYGNNGQIESPSFLVRTDAGNGIGEWFEKEWAYLSKAAADSKV